jgi:hypothetical protein
MTNITSEYATLPRRLGENGMPHSVREGAGQTESRAHTTYRCQVGDLHTMPVL